MGRAPRLASSKTGQPAAHLSENSAIGSRFKTAANFPVPFLSTTPAFGSHGEKGEKEQKPNPHPIDERLLHAFARST
jgi:hypothetical protein